MGKSSSLFLLMWMLFLPSLGESEFLKSHGQKNLDANLNRQHMNPTSNGRPYFASIGKTYRIRNGYTVTLECSIENIGSSVIVWKQTDRIISAGEVLLRKDSRMSLIKSSNGFNLQLANVTPDDRGEYICEVETFGDPIHQMNNLNVLVPPVISSLHPGSNLTVRKGSTVKLACNATGFPKPDITWQREYQMLPSGEKQSSGSLLSLPNVSRHDSGTYICEAANGVDNPVRAKIDLRIIFEPEIQVDKVWVHADVSVEVEISCIVHAEPMAEVKWYRDTMLLDPNESRLMEKFGIRHTLVLRKVAEEDFGNYSCSAENHLGKSRAFIEVSGRPNIANVTSPSLSYHSDHYNISWSIDSFSDINQYRISCRKVIPIDDPMYDTRSRWHNIVLNSKQVSLPSKIPLQRGSYMFYALEPSSQYEVVIQSQNRWGWSENSDPFFFSTRANDFKPKVDETKAKATDSKIKGVGGVDDSLVFQNNMHQESFLPISSSQSVKVDCYTLIFAITMLLLKY